MFDDSILRAPLALFERLDLVWTFILLLVRFMGLFMVIPGLGSGVRGLAVRTPAGLSMAFASASVAPVTALPHDAALMAVQVVSELLFGLLIGIIPLLIVAGAQMAGQLSSSTMGLAAGSLIDPSQGGSVTPISMLLGDLVTVVFLLLGGHQVAVYVASGLGGQIPPGTLVPFSQGAELLINRSAYVFEAGVILSAPVIVALLLTQFVMGLISKAVPTVNIFIVSFPLTIGVGLVLTILSLPLFVTIIGRQMTNLETIYQVITSAM